MARVINVMAKPVVFIIGASGKIGAATVTQLASKYADELEIRAGVRNPEKADKLKALPGVSVVQAEMGPDKNLVETFRGVHTLFINTPPTENKADLVFATAEAAKSAGVKHIVVVSVLTAGLADHVFGRQSGKLESAIKQLGVPYTILRLTKFVENFFGLKDSIKGQSSIFCPADPTKALAFIVVQDAGKAGAVILADPSKHVDKTYKLISGRYTHNEVVAAFSAALGREIKYVRIPYEDAKKSYRGVEEWRVDGFLELYKLVDVGSKVIDEPDRDDFTKITGEKPTDLEKWLSLVAEAFK